LRKSFLNCKIILPLDDLYSANKLKYTDRISILIDMEHGEFRLEVLEAIEDIMTNHYPCRLNRIFIVNINLEKITTSVQSKFQQNFYKKNCMLFDENYIVNLIRFFDP
jgi:hypothetical protein